MITLFHGSNVTINEIDLSKGVKDKDFGYSKIKENMTKETKFLLETLTKNLVLKVMEEFNYSITEAMDVVYNSQLYEKVLDLETGLYYQSAGYNYDFLRHELLTGKVA